MRSRRAEEALGSFFTDAVASAPSRALPAGRALVQRGSSAAIRAVVDGLAIGEEGARPREKLGELDLTRAANKNWMDILHADLQGFAAARQLPFESTDSKRSVAWKAWLERHAESLED